MDKIICIGSSSKDIFFPTDKGIVFDTPEDITSQRKIAFELGAKYQVAERFEALGGCAANVASGLVRLGITDVECCTKIGDDAVGQWIESKLSDAGVGTQTVQKQNECKSDLSSIIVDIYTAERIIFSDRDANEKLEILPKELYEAEWFFVSSLNGDWQGNLKKISEIAKEKKINIAFNPGQRNIATGSASVAEFISNSRMLMVNKDEALEIVANTKEGATPQELNDESYLLKALKDMGPEIVLITDGIRGAWAMGKGEIFHAEALVVKAVDTTGSGDAFTAGFFAALLKNEPIKEALKWGIINSSSAVKYYGGQEGLLNEKQIELAIKDVSVELMS